MSTATLDAPETTPADAPPTPDPEKKPDISPPPPTDPAPEPEKKAAEGEPSFTLTLPESSTLDPAAVERTAALARTLGLSNDQAQAALELASQEAQTALESRLAALQPGGEEYTRIVNEQAAKWEQETLARPEFGATEAERKAAIQRGHNVIEKFAAAHPEDGAKLKDFLNTTGYGNHPALAGLFVWLGKAAGESPLVTGAPPAPGKKPLAQRIYPNMNP